MRILTYLSNLMIPLFIFLIIGMGLLEKRDIYTDFLEGAENGLKTVVKIMPALIGMMTAVGVLRASGFLEFLAGIVGRITEQAGFPGELMPLTLVRFFSSTAATGLLLDVFKKYGADSRMGWMASLILGATESVFYCMSVYFGFVRIRRTRYTLIGALFSSVIGVMVSVWIVQKWGIVL